MNMINKNMAIIHKPKIHNVTLATTFEVETCCFPAVFLERASTKVHTYPY